MKKPTLRELFIKYLTQDSTTMDARRREFNQAIFDAGLCSISLNSQALLEQLPFLLQKSV
jgi:hypothetical protein